MIELRTLGGLELRGSAGSDMTSLLAHHKPIALLAYLAIAGRRGFERRDALAALLWPRAEPNRGRDSLREAVGVLRRYLGDEVIVEKDDELALNAEVVRCDAVDFEAAVDDDRLNDALDLYRGDLLPAFSVHGAPDFHAWLERQRVRLRLIAAQALQLLARRAEEHGEFTLATDCARWEVELGAPDERPLRRLMELLERIGDSAGAVAAYEEFAAKFAREQHTSPSEETQALVARIRTGGVAASPAVLERQLASVAESLMSAHTVAGVDTVTPLTEATTRMFAPPMLPVADRRPAAIPTGSANGPLIRGYAVERELGRGGAAIVYLARELKHDRMVALKVLRPELAGSVVAERFLLEISIAARLSHPNILQLYDSGRSSDLLYYAAPYVAGESLRKRIERERQLAVPEAIRIVREVAAALDYAHREGVVHRDVKPENILLADGHAVVADFGIARALMLAGGAHLTESGIAVGTPHYVCPEQASGADDVDGRADIYSLGCVLYELLAGSPPYTGVTPQQILALHATAPVPSVRLRRPTVSEALEDAIAKSLAKTPVDRFNTAAEFAEALAEDRPSKAPPPKWKAATGAVIRVVNSHRVAVAVGMITLTAGTVWAVIRDPPHSRGLFGGSVADTASGPDTSRYAVVPMGTAAGRSDEAAQLLRSVLRRWSGITVVDAFEVNEALRRSSAQRSGGRAAQTAAAKVDAGRYVRLSVSRNGDSLGVQAALFDTRTNALLVDKGIRVGPDIARADSAMAVLADSLLFRDVGPRVRLDVNPGTRSLAARQAYIRGHAAIEAWDLARADSEFFTAAQHDPQYAQALLWLAQVRSWIGEPNVRWSFAAEQAAVGRERLSARDRTLAAALLALGRGQLDRACPLWARITELNATDFTAWYALGNCLRSDDIVVRDGRSPPGWRFRTSYHAAVQAYRRAFQLHPSIHRSFRGGSWDEIRGLLVTGANAVRHGRASPPDTTRFSAYPSWNGDSLAFVPLPVGEFANLGAQSSETRNAATRHQRELFHEIATMWRAAFPQSADALEAVAVALDLLGNASAIDTLRFARRVAIEADDRLRMATLEVWMRLKLSTPSDLVGLREARRLADSLVEAHRPVDAREAKLLASMAALLGRATRAAEYSRLAALRAMPPARPVPAAIAQTAPALLAFAALGGPVDSLRSLEPRVDRAIASNTTDLDRSAVRSDWLVRAALLAVPHHQFASIQSIAQTGSVRGRLLDSWRTRDLGRARQLLDSVSDWRRRASIRASDVTLDGLYPEAAVLFSLGEYRGALAWLTPTLDSLSLAAPQNFADVARAGALMRAMVLRAELADRVGQRADSRAWARAVALLWSRPDAFLKPTLARMQALAR
jgi:DNA-binding SARP family transcriptional activator/tetratricopeptide (TPR) repeat protein